MGGGVWPCHVGEARGKPENENGQTEGRKAFVLATEEDKTWMPQLREGSLPFFLASLGCQYTGVPPTLLRAILFTQPPNSDADPVITGVPGNVLSAP